MNQSMSRILMLATVGAMMTAPVCAQEAATDGYLLRMAPKVGVTYKIRSVIDGEGTIMTQQNAQPMPFSMQMSMSLRQNIVSVDADSNSQIKLIFDSLTITANGSPVNTPPAQDISMQLKVNKLGVPIAASGMESLTKLMPNGNVQGFMNSLMGQSGVSAYPEKAVKVGESWETAINVPNTTSSKILAKSTLEAVDDMGGKKIARIATKFSIDIRNFSGMAPANLPEGLDLTGTLTGTSNSNVDLATGMTLDSSLDLNTEINVTGEMRGEPTNAKLSMAFNGNVTTSEMEAAKPVVKPAAKPAVKKAPAKVIKPVKKPAKK